MTELERFYDRIFISCGTATTWAGMTLGNAAGSQIYGVSALKGGDFLWDTVKKYISKTYQDEETEKELLSKITLINDAHFGGYAKINDELITFMRNFTSETGVKLDPVYTAKTGFAMCRIADSMKGVQDEKWLFIHSGGMQGLHAMEIKKGVKIY
jgi:1-aminocyclopropane-1-carboxylate deaminase